MKQDEGEPHSSLLYVTANSLVRKGIPLTRAMKIARDAGADGFEVRRELLPQGMHPSEVQNLHAELALFSAPPAYSVPRPLFMRRRLDRDFLLKAHAEAHSFGCQLVKFSAIGMEPGEQEFAALSTLLTAWQQEAPKMKVTVENDQTEASGDLALWVHFFEQAQFFHCPIWMTFDVGNWSCVGVDATEAAQLLGRFVAYIHVKAVERKEDQWIARPIHASSSPHPVLRYLASTAPRALEFPIDSPDQETLVTTLRAYIKQLRAGTFVT